MRPPPAAAILCYRRSEAAFGFRSRRTFACRRYDVRARCAIACRRYPALPLFLCAQFPSPLRAITMTAARRRYGLLPLLAGRLRFPQPLHPRPPQLRSSVAMCHCLPRPLVARRSLVPSSLFPSYSSLPLSFIVASTRRSSLPRPLIPLPLVF